MKTQKSNYLKLSLSLFLMSSFFVGCQKSSLTKATGQQTPVLLDIDKKAASVLCSNKMLQMNSMLRENQTKILENDSQPMSNQQILLKKQTETCQALRGQFAVDKVTSCLLSEDRKTIQNSIFQADIESSCKVVSTALNKMTLQQGTTTVPEKQTALVLNFADSSQVLLQSKDSTAEFSYLGDNTIKKGLDYFHQDIVAGKLVCGFQTLAESSTRETQFSTTAETSEDLLNTGLVFTGPLFSLALEDSQKLMLSMTCYNMAMKPEANRKQILLKAFGNLISITKKLVITNKTTEIDSTDLHNDPKLNQDVAPTIPAIEDKVGKQEKEPSNISEEKQKKANEAMNDLIAKAKDTIQEVVKDTLVQVKATTDQARTETIADVKKAAQEVSKDTIANASVAAKEVSKVIIQDAKVAANEVVAQSVTTVKKAVVDTIKTPFIYVGKKMVEVKDAVVSTTQKAATYIDKKATEAGQFFGQVFSTDNYWTSSKSTKSK